MNQEKCQCAEILQNEYPIFKKREITIHLTGCPENYENKEYNKLPWYKKIFKYNPKHYYDIHKSQTIWRT